METLKVRCRFEFLLFPKRMDDLFNGFNLVKYKALDESFRQPEGEGHSFVACGPLLPIAPDSDYVLEGNWEKSKYGWNFKVVSYAEQMPTSEKGIISFLMTLEGVGKRTAEKIYNLLGAKTLEKLSDNPDLFKTIPGISSKKAEKIKASFQLQSQGKELLVFLLGFKIRFSAIAEAVKKLGNTGLEQVKENPYLLLDYNGFSFEVVEKIAKSLNYDLHSPNRIRAGLLEVLRQAGFGGALFRSNSGHLYLEYPEFCQKATALLGAVTNNEIGEALLWLQRCQKIRVAERRYIYLTQHATSEYGIAVEVSRLLNGQVTSIDCSKELASLQQRGGIRLAPEQIQAVKTSLNSSLSIITGGPGTGKTWIEKLIIEFFEKNNPKLPIVLCAPTGQAARRMREQSGRPAKTIHRALGIRGDTNYQPEDLEMLEKGLYIVDEFSMMDSFITHLFLSRIPTGSQVVFIGDKDQLPSVGPGSVLKEMIESKVIPVSYLEEVFRQKKKSNGAKSTISINAARIKRGITDLEYDETFRLIEVDNEAAAVSEVKRVVKEALDRGLSLDDQAVLTPLRQRTATGVNELNPVLKNLVNPARGLTIQDGHNIYSARDKVMQTKNIDMLNNGDVGYIKRVYEDDGVLMAEVDFGDDLVVEYEKKDLENLDMAYANTVHKSQGSEYKLVVMMVMPEHDIMLKRNLFYTGVTRGKEEIVLIGSRKCVEKAILNIDTSKRNTRLAKIIRTIHEDPSLSKKLQFN